MRVGELEASELARIVTPHALLTLGSDYADPNRLAFTFWILQACLLGLFFGLERFR